MRIRRIAVLIDGGFFLKRLPKLVEEDRRNSADAVADTLAFLCRRHVQRLIGERFSTPWAASRYLDHAYRFFYYDSPPYDGMAHNPISNRQIAFKNTDTYRFQRELHAAILHKRKFAFRQGKLSTDEGWKFKQWATAKKLLRTRECIEDLEALLVAAEAGAPLPALPTASAVRLRKVLESWQALNEDDVQLGFRQKGVDMRIGIDITTLTLKKQVDTIVLVTGDSDFVPAAKVARREGVEFLLDPLWQQVNDDLHEHVDGIVSAFRRPDGQASGESNDGDADSATVAEPTDATYSADEE